MFRGVLPINDGDPREPFVEGKHLTKPEGRPSGRLRLRVIEGLVGNGTDVGILPDFIAFSSHRKAQYLEMIECFLAQLPQPVRTAVSQPLERYGVPIKGREG